MDFTFKNSLWQAQNLPEGFSINHGVLSGSHGVKGSYSVPVTVTTPFGSDTKNITIIVKNKPGTEKFSILQEGVEIEKVTIPQLVASIQDGSAQEKYNCSDTQLVIPITSPNLSYKEKVYSYELQKWVNNKVIIPSQSQDVALNFCSFQNVTLQDGSTRPGLILQFNAALWHGYAPFDTNSINRWKFSNLRQWLNSSGLNWFSPAYEGDALTPFSYAENDCLSSYVDDDACGFLDLLPYDIINALLPIRIVTQCYWKDDMPEPELINNVDCDVTYDKVFIPSLQELYLDVSGSMSAVSQNKAYPDANLEGIAWQFYINHLKTQNPFKVYGENGDNAEKIKSFIKNWYQPIYEGLDAGDPHNLLTRSPNISNNIEMWTVTPYYDTYDDFCRLHSYCYDLIIGLRPKDEAQSFANPAPAFVLG